MFFMISLPIVVILILFIFTSNFMANSRLQEKEDSVTKYAIWFANKQNGIFDSNEIDIKDNIDEERNAYIINTTMIILYFLLIMWIIWKQQLTSFIFTILFFISFQLYYDTINLEVSYVSILFYPILLYLLYRLRDIPMSPNNTPNPLAFGGRRNSPDDEAINRVLEEILGVDVIRLDELRRRFPDTPNDQPRPPPAQFGPLRAQ